MVTTFKKMLLILCFVYSSAADAEGITRQFYIDESSSMKYAVDIDGAPVQYSGKVTRIQVSYYLATKMFRDWQFSDNVEAYRWSADTELIGLGVPNLLSIFYQRSLDLKVMGGGTSLSQAITYAAIPCSHHVVLTDGKLNSESELATVRSQFEMLVQHGYVTVLIVPSPHQDSKVGEFQQLSLPQLRYEVLPLTVGNTINAQLLQQRMLVVAGDYDACLEASS